jgi:hypothetical protein
MLEFAGFDAGLCRGLLAQMSEFGGLTKSLQSILGNSPEQQSLFLLHPDVLGHG